MEAAIYNQETGIILRVASAPQEFIANQCGDGEEFYLNCPREATHIINNEPVTIVATPTESDIVSKLEKAVQDHLDATARTRTYASIDSAAKYIGGSNQTWSAEGVALREWAIAVWETVYHVRADVTAGIRDIPKPDELVAELPPMMWPEL